MFEQSQEILQYIAGLKSQLAALQEELSDLRSTPDFIRKRKGMEARYKEITAQAKVLQDKIKMSNTRAAELMAMEEANNPSMRTDGGLQKYIKIAAIGSGVLLVTTIIGVIIYKKIKK